VTLTRPILRVALLAAVAATLVLGGCGRKGPLDPPPAASLAGDGAAPNSGTAAKNETAAKSEKAPPIMDSKGRLITPPGPNKSIPLDVLLN
jgi:predicted small lipoprotein YifL